MAKDKMKVQIVRSGVYGMDSKEFAEGVHELDAAFAESLLERGLAQEPVEFAVEVGSKSSKAEKALAKELEAATARIAELEAEIAELKKPVEPNQQSE